MATETLAGTVQLQVTHERLKDLLVTAVEGGSNYWARLHTPRPLAADYDSIHVTELEPHGAAPAVDKRVTADDLLAGLQALAVCDLREFENARKHLMDAIGSPDDSGDAITADVVLQMTVFGALIYG